MIDPAKMDQDLAKAVRHFWATRNQQATKQLQDGRADQGARGSVTGGKQMDGFVEIIRRIVQDLGIPKSCIHCSKALELPGFFRPEKKWDLIVVDQGTLVAAIEFKSQVGPSFGNNFNNRSEEAIGSAQDVWTAYREGAFRTSDRPWLGFVMLLEDSDGSTKPVQVKQPHFDVFPEFKSASYADRYKLLMNKLMRERLYDSCSLLMSSRKDGAKGKCKAPDAALSFQQLVSTLSARIISHLSLSTKKPKAD
jgi:hypothetical protein